jgi:predicted Zn-dependent protease
LAPARELLADMLLAAGRPAEALAEYRASLTREPNRYLSLEGAAKSAAASGDRDAESRYRAEIAKLIGR